MIDIPIDIGSHSTYPASMLSNFAPHRFTFDDIPCYSMEGLLQSFKFYNDKTQVFICKMIGAEAKKAGKSMPWFKTQNLYWRGITYNRHSPEYQKLLTQAYNALFSNSSFRDALRRTGNRPLTHSIGKSSRYATILTEEEFCGQLIRLRGLLE